MSFSGSETAQTIQAPDSGKTLYVERLLITVDSGATAGAITIFDGSDTATSRLYKGKPGAGVAVVIEYRRPRPLSAANNVLQYTTGASVTGEIVAEGYQE